MAVKKWYTIYEADNDEILTIGVEEECTKNLGFTSKKIFREMISKVKIGRNKKYIIVIEEVDDDYEDIDGNMTIYGETNCGTKRIYQYDFNVEEAMSLYMNGYNDKEIAEILHVDKTSIQRWRDRSGLKSWCGRGRPRKRRY